MIEAFKRWWVTLMRGRQIERLFLAHRFESMFGPATMKSGRARLAARREAKP